MPRNVTATFDDGSTHVYSNTPDDVTPEAITERAAKDFTGKKVVHLDGGKAERDDNKHSSEEYEAPTGDRLTPEARRMEKQLRKAGSEGLGAQLKGLGEAGLAAAGGLVGTSLGGLRGLGTLLAGGSGEAAAGKIRATQEAFTRTPRTVTGQLLTGVAGELGAAPGKLSGAAGGAVGAPIGGVIGALKNGPEGYKAGAEQGEIAGEAIGEALPAILPAAKGLVSAGAGMLKSSPKLDSRGARLLSKAMEDMTPEDIDAARQLVAKSAAEGVPLTGPEAFKIAPKLHKLLTDVDKANPVIARFVKERPEQARAAIEKRLGRVGEDVGVQEAANTAQEAATGVMSTEQKARSAAAGPKYQAQRASDEQALRLMDQIKTTQKSIESGTTWRNDAVQQAGRWYSFSHHMGMKANNIAETLEGWARKDAALSDEELDMMHEGGGTDVRASKQGEIENYLEKAGRGRAAAEDAVKEAARRREYVDNWQQELSVRVDQLAQKNLPAIQAKVRGFMTDLDAKIRLAGPGTEEGKILGQFKNDLTPEGEPLMLPSQLESVYKSNRDKLELGLTPKPIDRTTAGVLKSHIKNLDNLIQEVSPDIKEGREIYAQISREVIDPLMKGPIGRIAGRGADAQKEAVTSRVMSEFQGAATTPDRIRKISSELGKQDPTAFPNAVRAHLEEKFNKASIEKVGQNDMLSGAKFAEFIGGSPKERANLAVMIEETAKSQGQSALVARQAARGFNNMLEVLQATGRIPKIGVQGIEEAQLGLAQQVGLTALHPNAYGTAKGALEKMWAVIRKKDYANLAKAFTDPAAIDKMVQLANAKKTNAALRQQLVADILSQGADATGAAAVQPKKDRP